MLDGKVKKTQPSSPCRRPRRASGSPCTPRAEHLGVGGGRGRSQAQTEALLLALLLPAQFYANQTTAVTLWALPRHLSDPKSSECHQQSKRRCSAVNSQSLRDLVLPPTSLLRPRNVFTSPSSKANPSGIWTSSVTRKNRPSLNLIPQLILLTHKRLRISDLIGLKSMCRAWLDEGQYYNKSAGGSCTR